MPYVYRTIVRPHFPSGSSSSLNSTSLLLFGTPLLSIFALFLPLSLLSRPSPTFSQGQPPALLLSELPIVPLLLSFSPSFSFISIILCAPLHLSPSTVLFLGFHLLLALSWPFPHPVAYALLIFLKALLLVSPLFQSVFYSLFSNTNCFFCFF